MDAMPPGDSTIDHNSRANHPVWAVYDERRTARLNIKCLNAEIKSLQRKNKLVEGTIALSGASSIGGFWFLQNVPGSYIWKTLGVEERKSYDDQAKQEFHSALARKREILGQADGSSASQRTIKKFQDEVNRELPSSQFYIPEEK